MAVVPSRRYIFNSNPKEGTPDALGTSVGFISGFTHSLEGSNPSDFIDGVPLSINQV
jgi:hypothetical protein